MNLSFDNIGLMVYSQRLLRMSALKGDNIPPLYSEKSTYATLRGRLSNS